MATTDAYSFTSMPHYNIHGNRSINQNYQVLVSDGSNTNTGTSQYFYPISLNDVQGPTFPPLPFQQTNGLSYYQPQIGLTAQPLLYNTGMAYTRTPFQIPASLPTATTAVPSLASSSSMSLQSPLTSGPSAVPLQKELRKASLKSQAKGKRTTRNATQVAKGGLLTGKSSKRRRGPNKRPAGTSFSHLLDGLPDDVKKALEAKYAGCCEAVNNKDTSTRQKHIFSNRHCRKLSNEYQELVPNFVCPAFVAFKSSCKSKAGRYDSTDRHSRSCDGFYHINKDNTGVLPVVITRSHYEEIQRYRMTHDESKWGKHATDPAGEESFNRICAVLSEIFKDGIPSWYPADMFRESDVSAIVDGSAPSPPPSPSPPPTIPILEPLPTTNLHFNQPSFCAPSSFNAEALSNESAEAFNGLPLTNFASGSNISYSVPAHASEQLLTNTTSGSVSIPVSNHLEPPSSHSTSLLLSDPETAHESAEATMNSGFFPVGNGDGEYDLSELDAMLDGTAGSSTMSASIPEEDHLEQTSIYEPLITDPKDLDEWDRLFADF